MTNFYGLNSAGDTNTGYPGAAPANTIPMQGNPNPPGDVPDYVPAQQIGGNMVLGSTPDINDQISNGAVSLNSRPTNVLTAPGTDSLLAQISRGQLSLNQTNYGQGSFIPQNGGCSPQAPQPGSAAVVPVNVGNPATPTFANPNDYTGN